MGSFRSKDNMRQRDCAKGVDREYQKEGDYATTRLCEGGGWGDSEVMRLMRQRDSAKGVDGEIQKQGYHATTRLCEGGGWRVSEKRRPCDVRGL